MNGSYVSSKDSFGSKPVRIPIPGYVEIGFQSVLIRMTSLYSLVDIHELLLVRQNSLNGMKRYKHSSSKQNIINSLGAMAG